MRDLLKSVFNIFYPPTCSGCNNYTDAIICSDCVDTFRPVESETACPLCGRPTGRGVACGSCMNDKIPFKRAYFGYYFEDRLRDTIHSFKFNGRIESGKYLVHLMRERILRMGDAIDCIVPVPVTAKRLYGRGFNQSFIIGEEISRITGKSIYPSLLVKRKETRDQFTLSKKERKQNVRGVFAVKNTEQISGKCVLLVDDLFTTGYTAREASRLLMRSSAEEVVFFALARTPS